MIHPRVLLENVGPIARADVKLTDLTVLVGPQATGKTLFLQLWKLHEDFGHICAELKQHGVHWQRDIGQFLDVYLGAGMKAVWTEGRSSFSVNGREVPLAARVGDLRRVRDKEERVYYIPAQRVLTLSNGWPRPFTDYSAEDPYVVRRFSESVRRQMETGFGRADTVFPMKKRLREVLKDRVNGSIFHGYQLILDHSQPQKRLMLKGPASSLPFMVWSAGQREFVPLLLGLYWLMPAGKVSLREGVGWAVLEELENGLHPNAIVASLLLVLELVTRGYRVLLSTHSQVVLDVLWAIRRIRDAGRDPKAVAKLFELSEGAPTLKFAETLLDKEMSVFYFGERKDGKIETHDISALDPGSDDPAVSGWGGLTRFSGHVGEVVAEAIAGMDNEPAE